MKKSELDRKLKKMGWFFSSNGKRHERWENGLGCWVMVPRHPKIQEGTAKAIMKKANQAPGK